MHFTFIFTLCEAPYPSLMAHFLPSASLVAWTRNQSLSSSHGSSHLESAQYRSAAIPVHAEMQQAKSIPPFPLRTPVPRFSSPGPRGRSHGDRLQELRPFSIWVPQGIDLLDKSRSQPTLLFREKTIEHGISLEKSQDGSNNPDSTEEHGDREQQRMKIANLPQGNVQGDMSKNLA